MRYLFNTDRPTVLRALLTLRHAKRLNEKQADTVSQQLIDAATKHCCASGVPWQRVRTYLIAGGYTPADADAQVNGCYPSLPLVSGQ